MLGPADTVQIGHAFSDHYGYDESAAAAGDSQTAQRLATTDCVRVASHVEKLGTCGQALAPLGAGAPWFAHGRRQHEVGKLGFHFDTTPVAALVSARRIFPEGVACLLAEYACQSYYYFD